MRGPAETAGGASSFACPVRVSDDRCALVSPTTSVAVTRSPGSLPDSSAESLTVNGIVIPGMKPLMSS